MMQGREYISRHWSLWLLGSLFTLFVILSSLWLSLMLWVHLPIGKIGSLILFTVDEWNLFKQGYAEFVTLTDLEKEYWFIAIEHIFVDEVIWLMADFSEGWKMQHQLGIYSSIFKCILTPSVLQQYDLEINT